MIEEVVAAIERGGPVILPTDTVYGLCADPLSAAAVRRMYDVKGRVAAQPTAILASSADAAADVIPELRGLPLLPGPFTLILPNPARRLSWLTGSRPETIGVRLPALVGDAAAVLELVGAVAATSANLPGSPDPRRLDDIPLEIRERCAAVVDGGELPGAPSTVIDLTGSEPVVVREGAVRTEEALRRLRGLSA